MIAPLEHGDRIELVSMENDPCPIPVGATGTVEECDKWSDKTWTVRVRWDNGRSLALCIPPDVVRKIS